MEQVTGYLEEWDVPAGGVRQSDEDRQSRREALDKARAPLVALRSATSMSAHTKANRFQYNVIPFMHSASVSRSVWSVKA